MRTILILLTFIFSLNVQAQKRPTNIVIIFIDDMGYADIGPFGAKNYPTPNLDRMAEEGRGVVVYLREGSVGVGKASGRRLPEEHAEAQDREAEWREIGLGAQILKDLGIASIKLYSSRERHYVGLEGFGIQISSTEII